MLLRQVMQTCALVAAIHAPIGVAKAAAFEDLLRRVPSEANTLVIIDVDAVYKSPIAIREQWKKEKAASYADRPTVLPPGARQMVMAARVDLETMAASWKVAILAMNNQVALEPIVEAERGRLETLAGSRAVWTPLNVYFIELTKRMYGILVPADRQRASQWVRYARTARETLKKPSLSPFLKKAADAVESGKAEFVMAIDLVDAVSPNKLREELKGSKVLAEKKISVDTLSTVLASIQGAALGIKLGEKPQGRIRIDFSRDPSIMAPIAKSFFIEVVEDMGAHIEDFDEWTASVSGKSITLDGSLSKSGIRQLTSVLELPSPNRGRVASKSGGEPDDSTEAKLPTQAENSQKYFKSVNILVKDLRRRAKSGKSYRVGFWFRKYADRIDSLPLVNVDVELLDFGLSVGERFRQAAMTMEQHQQEGRSRAAQFRAQRQDRVYGYGPWGGTRTYRPDNSAARRQAQTERRRVSAEARAKGRQDANEIMTSIEQDTSRVRITMSKRYEVEF